MKRRILAACAVLALAACEKKESTTVASLHSENGVTQVASLNMTDYAVRAALGNNTSTAAYVAIHNGGNTPDTLLSASCACAGKATLHTMTMSGSVMQMAEKTGGFVIRPGETLTFAPGGNHIMLEDLTTRPADGTTEAVTLVFEKAGPVTLQMPVSNTPLAGQKTQDSQKDAMSGMKM